MTLPQTKNIKIAFSGSGFLAPIHVGAFSAFVDAGYKITEVSGTSGGSIAAALIASGKTSKEMFEMAMQPLPSGILRVNIGALLSGSYGYCNGNVLLNWLMDQIGENVTFANAKIPVTLMATDIVHGVGFELSAKTFPDMTLALACRASSAVPFVWTPVKFAPDIILVDGGVINNIPVNKLSVDADSIRVGVQVDDKSSTLTKFNLISYSKQLIGSLLSANEDTHVDLAKATGAYIIPVSANGLGFLDPRLTNDQKTSLYQSGYNAVSAFLKGQSQSTNNSKASYTRRRVSARQAN